jgi:hypothetical protein
MIIGLSGRMGVGKDLFAKIVSESNPDNFWQTKRFAGKLKEIASIITGVPINNWENQAFKEKYMGDDWGMTYREFLQRFGTDSFRNNVHPNVWVNALISEYDITTIRWNDDCCASYYDYPNWIVTDVRFPNEAEAIRKRGYPLVRINRDGVNKSNHSSESALDNYGRWDFVIDNNGTIEDFKSKVYEFLERVDPYIKPEYGILNRSRYE